MSIAQLVLEITNWAYNGLYIVVGIFGIIGAITVLTTREDAFTAADRKPKMVWLAMLLGSAVVLIIPFGGLNFLAWVGAVVIGVYWFDVRPQLRNLLAGRW